MSTGAINSLIVLVPVAMYSTVVTVIVELKK